MTHMHIPDGILPVWLWVSGFILMVIILGFSLLQLRNMDMKRKIPLLGAVAAAILVAMSLEIFIIGYHVNLSVAAGILLGPALGFVAAFIANLMLALMGHGGITVMGLNTLLLGSEAVLGHTVFFLLGKRLPVFWRAATATVLTQFVATLLLIGIVAVSRVNPALFGHEEEHAGAIRDSVRMFAAVVLSLGSIGWVIEAAITGSVMKFISQVKPDLLGHVLHRDKSTER
jgi:cobalt/nickel transport system permease protein